MTSIRAAVRLSPASLAPIAIVVAALCAPPAGAAAAQAGQSASAPSGSAAAPAAAAQGAATPVDGRILDTAGKPVPDIAVSLHRVGPAGGTQVGVDTTDAEGRFHFAAVSTGPGEVLFAAVRYEGELYVGQPLEAAMPRNDYEIEVGNRANAVNLGPVTSPQAEPAAPVPQPVLQRNATRFWAGIVLLALAAGAFLLLRRPARRGAPPEWRRTLMELAAVEERLDALGDPGAGGDAGERARYEHLRARLHARLTGPTPAEVDAARQ